MANIELKSEHSRTKAFVRFLNKTNRQIDIIWVDFDGVFTKYVSLKMNEYIDVNTFTNHPWIFLDSVTRDRMCVKNQQLVYYAEPWYKQFRFFATQDAITRVCVPIYFPLYSLQTCALYAVRNYLKNRNSIQALEIPNILKEDLEIAFNNQEIQVFPR